MTTKALSEIELMVTTKDNPFNPFTHFREWYAFDMASGYNTCGVLAAMTNEAEWLDTGGNIFGLRDIVQEDPLGVYILVTESEFDALMSAANDGEQRSE